MADLEVRRPTLEDTYLHMVHRDGGDGPGAGIESGGGGAGVESGPGIAGEGEGESTGGGSGGAGASDGERQA